MKLCLEKSTRRSWISAYLVPVLLTAALLAGGVADSLAQPGNVASEGTIQGVVTFEAEGSPVHGALVIVVEARRTARTDNDGRYTVAGLAAGTYTVVAQRDQLAAQSRTVTVAAGTVDADFALVLGAIQEQITVTAGSAFRTFEAFNSVATVDFFGIAGNSGPTLADVIQGEPGVATRSFGPGGNRPIIRGFDGDRVLIMQDGIRSGDLSSQSGDHGTTIDPGGLDRIEIVKGPATLLYGSNAVGGVVNAITPQEAFRKAPFSGLRGQVLLDGGSANAQGGLSANVDYGRDRWSLWAGGHGRRTGDYDTPAGTVENSATRFSSARAGLGYAGRRAFFGLGYDVQDGRYGIPFAGEFHSHGHEEEHDHDHEEGEEHDHDEGEDHEGEEHEEIAIDLLPRRHNIRFDFGFQELGNPFVDNVRFVANHIDWRHDEMEIGEGGAETLGTRFTNKTTALRAELNQRPVGRLTGRIGGSFEYRDYAAAGEEALAPGTTQHATALFGYEELAFGRARLMFGGRYERTSYDTEERDGVDVPPGGGHVHDEEGDHEILPPATRDRSFGGVSGSVGLHVDLGQGAALVTTLNRAYRAPALEELYNFGPHVGNLAFEIGNANLEREATVGLDVSLRHRSGRVNTEFNVFTYGIDNFVFAAFSPEEEVDGLRIAEYLQGDSRFTGVDGRATVELHERLWLDVNAGYVRATLTDDEESLPRIPPFRSRVALTVPLGSLRISPEIVWAGKQARIYHTETSTAAYGVFNLAASYSLGRPHTSHLFSVNAFNLTNALHRNHTSLIKDLAPEIGRGIRVSYALRFM